jgi:hypothetical protein
VKGDDQSGENRSLKNCGHVEITLCSKSDVADGKLIRFI